MKKINLKLKKWFIKRDKKNLLKRTFNKYKIRAKRQVKSGYFSENYLKNVKTVRLSAPKVFQLFKKNYRNELLEFIEEIRKWYKLKKKMIIDFSNVKKLYPCGVLLFVSEISRLKEIVTVKPKIKATYPKDDIVEEMLQHLGILKSLGLKHRKNVSHIHVKNWTYWHGTNVDLSGLEQLFNHLKTELGEAKALELFAAMQEAVTNVIHHAYIEDRGDGIAINEKGWWLFAEHVGGKVYLSVCDLGVGIRKTLPVNSPWHKNVIRSLISTFGGNPKYDSNHIKAAVELGATRTNEENRGKGLSEMRDVVINSQIGNLRIYSDRGLYSVNHEKKEILKEYSSSIKGTIIQWSFEPNTAL